MSALRRSERPPSPLATYRLWKAACARHEWAVAALSGEVSMDGRNAAQEARDAYADLLHWGAVREQHRLKFVVRGSAVTVGLGVAWALLGG